MDIGFSEEQELLRDTARKFLHGNCTTRFVRDMMATEAAVTPEFWRQLAENGWLGIALPEADGGSGLGLTELVVLMEEIGLAVMPGPFPATVLFGGAAIAETDALLVREIPGVRLVNFGHLGDGNLHYNVQAPDGGDAVAFLREQEERVNTLVYDQVARHGGSISAEHGVGSLKAAKLPHYKSPVALSLMRAIKGALDPKGTLNPGRVLG